ncbi:hypothetical protein [Mesorhizobium sp.]|uniref:hypothetical protein n=1 Tax=Mesorhizobium sp. TaxID=1871066 RepID=UPI000FE71B3C|nr:hypothetical protein [Mesorhizobium sp.]RWK60674.1 MAG: hypothetical protein EOR49_19775 [Mesorhizobium sp.]RWM46075.1 MAG: hypothetical protein EOR76_19890 [Mesorhizobium sp.]RWM52308.1 MAG: hypothetical protein EOR78_21650 [Mesorhizobium sp.]RWM56641.1 MAG: hypothetical protein EOR79_17905 [Mesorhizobium sp.]RWN00298.1 MAG: hypothetical protein EOR85_17345 [Mesorhizobium sp.]
MINDICEGGDKGDLAPMLAIPGVGEVQFSDFTLSIDAIVSSHDVHATLDASKPHGARLALDSSRG